MMIATSRAPRPCLDDLLARGREDCCWPHSDHSPAFLAHSVLRLLHATRPSRQAVARPGAICRQYFVAAPEAAPALRCRAIPP